MREADLGAGVNINNNNKNMAANTTTEAANVTPLPKCFCNWKNCRTYQKALREYKHPLYNGVIKVKFTKDSHKTMALKAAVDRTLEVEAGKRNDWVDNMCRYYIARHHFTEALMKQYLADRRAWDWAEPLTMKEAKTLLWSLDRQDVYHSDDEDSEEDSEKEEDPRYVQVPNVPKEQVRDLLKKLKSQKKKGAGSAAESVHTQSTLSTSVTDTLKAFEDIIGHQEVSGKDTALLEQKEEENTKLRLELNECQEQLSMLHSMVKQLKVDMDRTATTKPAKVKKKKKKVEKESSSEESNVEDDESSSESADEEEDDEEEDDEEEEEWSQERGRPSDDDETLSTLHVNAQASAAGPKVDGATATSSQASGGPNNAFTVQDTSNASQRSSGHSRNARSAVRKNSIHSRRSMRRDSVHSSRSVHSRSRHSVRRDSVHSRRSIRPGSNDDAASVVSRQSLQSVSPSIKSLPREIELMDDEKDDTQGKDDYSFFDDSYRKPDDDARSVGSRSAASRASRRSIVSGARSRGRNSRRPNGNSASNPPENKPSTNRGSGGGGGAVPREIDLSGDELEDETYANVSTDSLFVTDKQIVDPYGEKGVYTGALSKSTGMPNGKGRLEYEKEGRWYEGDWIHGRWTGYGRLSNGDGDFYEGGLKNDHKHGTGIMRFADGRVFEGEYIRGQMIQGKMTYQDGSVYGGSWVDGMRHGRGKCIFVDGSEYEGEFREGNFHGQGKMTWNDGGWYIGEWCDGEMHGKGKEIRPDGSLRHDGEWSRGQPLRSANESRSRRSRQAQQ